MSSPEETGMGDNPMTPATQPRKKPAQARKPKESKPKEQKEWSDVTHFDMDTVAPPPQSSPEEINSHLPERFEDDDEWRGTGMYLVDRFNNASAEYNPYDGSGTAFNDDAGFPIGPNHPMIPQAKNTVKKGKSTGKSTGSPDPNGRVSGRKLIQWHHDRMWEKITLMIQFECHREGINIPWDRVVHRLCPGSSGQALLQQLNKVRLALITEGHLVPPQLGKPGQPVDPTIRGYIRDDEKDDPFSYRMVGWHHDLKETGKSRQDHGIIRGSGKYRQKGNREAVQFKFESSPSLPTDLPGIPGGSFAPGGKWGAGKAKAVVQSREHLNKRRRPINDHDDDDDDEDEIDPAKLHSDADWTPTANKTKKGRRASKRIKSPESPENFEESDSEGNENSALATPGKTMQAGKNIMTPPGTRRTGSGSHSSRDGMLKLVLDPVKLAKIRDGEQPRAATDASIVRGDNVFENDDVFSQPGPTTMFSPIASPMPPTPQMIKKEHVTPGSVKPNGNNGRSRRVPAMKKRGSGNAQKLSMNGGVSQPVASSHGFIRSDQENQIGMAVENSFNQSMGSFGPLLALQSPYCAPGSQSYMQGSAPQYNYGNDYDNGFDDGQYRTASQNNQMSASAYLGDDFTNTRKSFNGLNTLADVASMSTPMQGDGFNAGTSGVPQNPVNRARFRNEDGLGGFNFGNSSSSATSSYSAAGMNNNDVQNNGGQQSQTHGGDGHSIYGFTSFGDSYATDAFQAQQQSFSDFEPYHPESDPGSPMNDHDDDEDDTYNTTTSFF